MSISDIIPNPFGNTKNMATYHTLFYDSMLIVGVILVIYGSSKFLPPNMVYLGYIVTGIMLSVASLKIGQTSENEWKKISNLDLQIKKAKLEKLKAEIEKLKRR